MAIDEPIVGATYTFDYTIESVNGKQSTIKVRGEFVKVTIFLSGVVVWVFRVTGGHKVSYTCSNIQNLRRVKT